MAVRWLQNMLLKHNRIYNNKTKISVCVCELVSETKERCRSGWCRCRDKQTEDFRAQWETLN